MEEFEKQLVVKRKLELVQDEAERLKFKAEERRKTQEAKDEAALPNLVYWAVTKTDTARWSKMAEGKGPKPI